MSRSAAYPSQLGQMEPMNLRALGIVVVLALTSTGAWPADNPSAQTREEENLLLDVGSTCSNGTGTTRRTSGPPMTASGM